MTTLQAAIGAVLLSLAITVLLTPGTVRMLRHLGAGKSIRSEGPAGHASKAGTPTMGGAVIVFAACSSTLVLAPRPGVSVPLVLLTLAFGALGGMDDLRALRRHRAMGLRAREKLAGQVIIALAFGAWALSVVPDVVRLQLPFSSSVWTLGPAAFLVLAAFAVTAGVNAVNLTDGLDGLAAGASVVAAVALAVAALVLDRPEVAIFTAAVAGSCLGFMWFNGYPAQVFMGDTGSLALGAALSGSAILLGTLLSLPIVGGLFVVETVSVMAQVVFFRMTGGRRLFRMSPFHHHLELSGWSEPQVVVRLWLVSAVFGLVGLASMLVGGGLS